MVDLNLIRVFVTIYETGSVSGAAERLHVTQPSVSYALSRLRTLLNDPLFRRTRDGMQPTFLATQLYAKFRFSLAEIERAIAQTRDFEPRVSSRCFRLALSDLGEIFFLPHLMAALRREAPGVELEIIQVDMERLGDWLTTGKIDAAVCNRGTVPVAYNSELLFEERNVCLVAADHPRIGESLPLERYLEEKHVVVSAATGHHSVEDQLRELRMERKISLRIPHFSVLPEIVGNSHLIATLPSRVAALFAQKSNTKVLELPFEVPAFEVGMFWSDHDSDILAQRWFCSLLKASLQHL